MDQYPVQRDTPYAPNTDLPAQLTSFIGRKVELAELETRLANARLLTLTGPGGCGKTRLALALAERHVRKKAPLEQVRFVDLTPLSEPAQVAQYIAFALGLPDSFSGNLEYRLAASLRSMQVLLVLDNCEHLIPSVSIFVDALLRFCPTLTVLATSREALAVAGEIIWSVPPLILPAEPESDLEKAFEADAIRLFVERARDVRSDFAPAGNITILTDICRRLDGLPLAIELAAARTRLLSIEQIAARLDRLFEVLRTDSHSAPQRHKTLQSVIDWSYQLLSDPEQWLFERLALFEGSFTLETVEGMFCSEDNPPQKILPVFTQLVYKSLVSTQLVRGQARYRLLETIRAYALEKLQATGEYVSWQNLFCEYYVNWFEREESRLYGPDQIHQLQWMGLEYDNLHAVLQWTLQTGQSKTASGQGLRLACSLWFFWVLAGRYREGLEWLEAGLAHWNTSKMLPDDSKQYARAQWQAGILAWMLRDFPRAREHAEHSLEVSRQAGAEQERAYGLMVLGLAVLGLNETELACELERKSTQIMRSIEDDWGTALALASLGQALVQFGDRAKAKSIFLESRNAWQRVGDRWGLALSTHQFAWLAYHNQEYEIAQSLFEESNEIFQQLGEIWHVGYGLMFLANIAWLKGHYEAAKEYFRQSIGVHEKIGNLPGRAVALADMSMVARAQKNLEEAAMFLKEAMDALARLDDRAGRMRGLLSLAGMAAAVHEYMSAAQLLGVADWDKAKDGPLPATYANDYQATLAAVREGLGPDGFAQAVAEGKAFGFSFWESAWYLVNQALKEGRQPEVHASSSTERPAGLTPRELEVLRLLADGLPDGQIAERLFLSRRTIHAHLRSIYSKLGVTTRAAATRIAIEQRLV